MKFEFVQLTPSHIPLLREWLKRPHVAEFWQEPEDENEFREKYFRELPEREIRAFIIYLNQNPIGYIQAYEACKAGGGYWPNEQPGTFGIDQYIGLPELISKGLGTEMIKEFLALLFAKTHAREVIVDPEPHNARAIRAYEKVGFKPVGPIKTPGGDALLMRLLHSDYLK